MINKCGVMYFMWFFPISNDHSLSVCNMVAFIIVCGMTNGLENCEITILILALFLQKFSCSDTLTLNLPRICKNQSPSLIDKALYNHWYWTPVTCRPGCICICICICYCVRFYNSICRNQKMWRKRRQVHRK